MEQLAKAGNEQRSSGSLLHPPLEGRRMPVTLEGPLSIRVLGDLGLLPMSKRSPSRAETCADNRGSEDSPIPGWS